MSLTQDFFFAFKHQTKLNSEAFEYDEKVYGENNKKELCINYCS